MLDATPFFRLYARHRLRRLAKLSPVEAQRRECLSLVDRAKGTRFGREHGFSDIRSVQDFQDRVPLRKYDDFWEAYWKDDYPVLENVTWPGRIPYFAYTSGTSTGRTKNIPVSREMVKSNTRATLDMISFHLAAKPNSRLAAGKNFMLGGNPQLTQLAPSVQAGDLTGIAAANVPVWARPYYFPRGAAAHIEDWEEKIKAQGRDSLSQDIRTIGGTASWLLLFFDKMCDIAGKPEGKLADFYPDLELVVYGGVNFAPYRDRFQAYLEGSHAEMREVYPASEGFIAAADRGVGEGLRLMADNGIFYEFVPLEEIESETPRRFWLETAETGVNYAVVVSNCAGSWGYVLGDTVRFVDLDPPRLLVTGRISYYLSAFGEHVMGEELERAVARAADEIGAGVRDFSVGPIFPQAKDELGRHLYIVEFSDPPRSDEALARFAGSVDGALQEINDDYRLHRAGGFGMAEPQIAVAPPGTFESWLKKRGRLGSQTKVPRVINDSDQLSSLRAELPGDRTGMSP